MTFLFSFRCSYRTDHDLSTSQTVCRVKVGKACLVNLLWFNNLKWIEEMAPQLEYLGVGDPMLPPPRGSRPCTSPPPFVKYYFGEEPRIQQLPSKVQF